MTALVLGVGGLNVVFLTVGYCLMSPELTPGRAREAASWCGVALLVGTGAVGVTVFLAVIAGARADILTFTLCSAALAGCGLAARRLRPARSVPATPSTRHEAPAAEIVATLAAFVVTAVAGFGLVGGFRSSPWLDDAWGIWLPKGLALAHAGLDPRLFAPGGTYVRFEVLDYPLWWSIVTALAVRFTGSIDLRAVDAELAILAVAFLGATARLLWGHARPWLVWGALLLLAASPAYFDHAQAGMADLPLAIYAAVWILGVVGWLATGRPIHLVTAGVAAAAAFAIKTEGLPEVALFLLVVTAAAWRPARRRLPAVWLVTGAAFLTYVPWLLWRSSHDVSSRVGLRRAFGVDSLADQAGRLGPSLRTVTRHLVDPTDWTVIVPLLLVLGILGLVRERRLVWLAPSALVAVGIAFWTWAYWSAEDNLDYLLATSSYRVIDPIVLAAAVLVPLEAERLLRSRGR